MVEESERVFTILSGVQEASNSEVDYGAALVSVAKNDGGRGYENMYYRGNLWLC